MHCLHGYRQQRTDDHAKSPDSETTESRIVSKWLFPPQFPDKDRFTNRPDFVLVTPIAAKTQKQQTNVGRWVLRSGRGQLRETGSTSAAAPATYSTATNPRQHRPKDLNKTRRNIHLVEIKYCEDTRPQNQLNTAKRRKGTAQRPLQHSPRSLRYSPHHPFGCGRHHLQHPHSEAFQRTGSRFSKS